MIVLYFAVIILPVLMFWLQQRSASQRLEYTEELRRVVEGMREQSEQLTKAREAARESKRECTQRENELKSLRSQVESLEEELSDVKTERDQIRNALEGAETKVTEFTSLLAKSEAKRTKLEADMTAASIRHLEVVSKLHTDHHQRMRAIRRLRKPERNLITQDDATPRPDDVPVFTNRIRPIAKSPSEAYLRNLRPDLSASDSDEDDQQQSHSCVSTGEGVPSRSVDGQMSRKDHDRLRATRSAFASTNMDVSRPTMNTNSFQQRFTRSESGQIGSRSASGSRTLSVQRNPWVDFLNPALNETNSTRSIAQVLQNDVTITSPGFISRSSRSSSPVRMNQDHDQRDE